MMDRAILVPIVRALRTKRIVGILAAVLRRVRTIVYSLLFFLYLHLYNTRPTKMERMYMCQNRRRMWNKEMLLLQIECRM